MCVCVGVGDSIRVGVCILSVFCLYFVRSCPIGRISKKSSVIDQCKKLFGMVFIIICHYDMYRCHYLGHLQMSLFTLFTDVIIYVIYRCHYVTSSTSASVARVEWSSLPLSLQLSRARAHDSRVALRHS